MGKQHFRTLGRGERLVYPWLSRIPVHGTFLHDLLPGMLVLSLGFGPVFVAVTTAANAGVPADKAELAASLLNASQQLGGALGLAIFTALATSHTHSLLAAHTPPAQALTAGFGRALLVGSVFTSSVSRQRTDGLPVGELAWIVEQR